MGGASGHAGLRPIGVGVAEPFLFVGEGSPREGLGIADDFFPVNVAVAWGSPE